MVWEEMGHLLLKDNDTNLFFSKTCKLSFSYAIFCMLFL